jgi:ATP-dependent helicase HrpB
MQRLPIDSHLDDIRTAIASNRIAIVEAPPGSGKTTRVAPFLLQHLESTSLHQRIYLLQPRRLAAKSVAERIAFEHGSELGSRIGYQVRFDNQVSRQTRLIVATEGVLLRRLQEDPAIEDTYAVVLDEFHERSLDGDLLLGMLRRVQQTLRDDLRIVIMSATIDTEMIRSLLGEGTDCKSRESLLSCSKSLSAPDWSDKAGRPCCGYNFGRCSQARRGCAHISSWCWRNSPGRRSTVEKFDCSRL